MATKNGLIKKTALKEYDTTRKTGLQGLIPITPCDTLPIGLTSFSSNVIHNPFLVTKTTLSSPSKKEVEEE